MGHLDGADGLKRGFRMNNIFHSEKIEQSASLRLKHCPLRSPLSQNSAKMSSALPLRRSPRVAAKARAKFVAARVAYETVYADSETAYDDFRVALADLMAKKIDPDFYDAVCDRGAALRVALHAALRAYDHERAAYKKAVGNDMLHICRNIANQPIYEELLKREVENPATYTRAARIVRTLRESLFIDDELIWDGDMFERFGSEDAVKFIDSIVMRYKQKA